MIDRPHVIARKFVLYGLTAGTAAVVDIGGFALLIHVDVRVLPAAVASFCAAAVVNYVLTSRFVFRVPLSMRRFAAFFAVAGVGLVINVGVTTVGTLALHLAPTLAKVAGVGIAFFANFVFNLKLFARVESRTGK